jgi:hypothetical protein
MKISELDKNGYKLGPLSEQGSQSLLRVVSMDQNSVIPPHHARARARTHTHTHTHTHTQHS